MIMTSIDIIILTKNNFDDLLFTLKSIPKHSFILIRALVVDGGDCQDHLLNIFPSLDCDCELVYVNSAKLGVTGIYPSMNLVLSEVTSDWFIFMNSGDKFHQDFSLSAIISFLTNNELDLIFGQALIRCPESNTQWLVPDSKISNIFLWLRFFEPNHQSIFARKYISHKYLFDISSPYGADALWKRLLILNERFVYYPMPIACFYLGGVSSHYNFSVFRRKVFEPSRRPFEKFMEIIKFILSSLGIMHPFLQKVRSSFIGFLF